MKKTVFSRDIGVYIENDQPQICYLDTTTNQFYSAKNPKQAVDKNVTLVKDLFTVKESTGDYFAQTVEPIKAENTVLDFIRTQKALSILQQISIYKQDTEWVTEDEGYTTVEVKNDKQISLDKLARAQENLVKLNNTRNINGQMLGVTFKNGQLEFCSIEQPLNAFSSKVFLTTKNQQINRNDMIDVFSWFKSKDGKTVCNPKIKQMVTSKKSLKNLFYIYCYATKKYPCKISSRYLDKLETKINNEIKQTNQQGMQL